MSDSKAARRYAQSLLDVAVEIKATELAVADCLLIDQTITDSRELAVFLKSPIIKSDKKLAVLKEIFGKKIQKLTSEFISVIVRKNRIDILGAIAKQFIELYNVYAGIVKIHVDSAEDLSKSQLSSLLKALETKTGKKVDLSTSVHKELMGGMTVKIHDTVIDGSVKHKLETLDSLFKNSAL